MSLTGRMRLSISSMISCLLPAYNSNIWPNWPLAGGVSIFMAVATGCNLWTLADTSRPADHRSVRRRLPPSPLCIAEPEPHLRAREGFRCAGRWPIRSPGSSRLGSPRLPRIRTVWHIGGVVPRRLLDHNRVFHHHPHLFSPACFKMLAQVPGGRSSSARPEYVPPTAAPGTRCPIRPPRRRSR